ncbi:MAG: iolG 16 [Acidobacteria bacterium]|nr:iolG 16 [Acidobacteriota bacterium]
MNRRDFMKTTVVATAASAIGARAAAAKAVQANDRLQVAFIGCGARAHQLMEATVAQPGIEVIGLCDAYTGRLERAKARTGGRAVIYRDYKELLASPEIDAVFIVTPDHWHKTMALDALAAKKDIYIEKPFTYTVEDGLAMVEAVKRSDRILQVGSQSVSSAEYGRARELIQAGKIGKVVMVRACYNRNSDSGAWLYPIPPDASPKTVDWEQFLGPAPKRPFDLNRFFRWRCYWDYSGGVATDLFVHLVSWMHFATGARAPKMVAATGETYKYGKTHEVPDTVNALLTYPEGFTANLTCTFNNEMGAESGMEFLGTNGSLIMRGGALTFKPEPRREDNRWIVDSWPEGLAKAYYDDPKIQAVESPFLWDPKMAAGSESWVPEGRDDTYTHIANFFASVRSRKQPVEDALFGHRAAACAHMVNRSIREKAFVEWDAANERMKA